jgi:hypothetical protein
VIEVPMAWVAPGSDVPTVLAAPGLDPIGGAGAVRPAGVSPPPARTGTRPLPLRPLSVLELLDAAVGAIRSIPRGLVVKAFALVGGIGVAGVGVQWAFDSAIATTVAAHPGVSLDFYGNAVSTPGSYTGSTLFSTFVVDALIPVVFSGFATTILAGLFAPSIRRYVDGEIPDPQRPAREPSGKLPVLIRIGLITLLPRLLLLALLALVASVSADNPQSGFGGLDTLFLVAGVPLCCWATAQWALAAPVAVLEGVGVRGALGRAARLVAHGRWRTWWATTLALFIGMCATTLLVGIGFAVDGDHVFGRLDLGSGGAAYRNLLGYLIVLVLPQVLTVPFRATTATMQYVDRRFRREGLDIRIAWARVSRTGAGHLDADRKAR